MLTFKRKSYIITLTSSKMVIIKREAYLPKERAAVKDTTYLYHVPTHIDTTIYDGKPNLLILLKIFICMKPVGFFGLLTLILITLKLTGVITWSWWLVLLPLIIPSITGLLLLVVILLIGLIDEE